MKHCVSRKGRLLPKRMAVLWLVRFYICPPGGSAFITLWRNNPCPRWWSWDLKKTKQKFIFGEWVCEHLPHIFCPSAWWLCVFKLHQQIAAHTHPWLADGFPSYRVVKPGQSLMLFQVCCFSYPVSVCREAYGWLEKIFVGVFIKIIVKGKDYVSVFWKAHLCWKHHFWYKWGLIIIGRIGVPVYHFMNFTQPYEEGHVLCPVLQTDSELANSRCRREDVPGLGWKAGWSDSGAHILVTVYSCPQPRKGQSLIQGHTCHWVRIEPPVITSFLFLCGFFQPILLAGYGNIFENPALSLLLAK